MRYFLKILVLLSWACWLGGMILLYVTIQEINREFPDRLIFGRIGGAMFGVFMRFQLVVGALACVSSMGLLILENRRSKQVLFFIFALAMAGALGTVPITKKIDAMRVMQQTTTPEFKATHKKSGMIFAGQQLLLLMASCLMPAVARREDQPLKTSGSA